MPLQNPDTAKFRQRGRARPGQAVSVAQTLGPSKHPKLVFGCSRILGWADGPPNTQLDKYQAVLQFRPKLTIRRILIYKGTQIPTIESKGDIPWRVGFYMSNHGGSAAHVRECDFSLIRLESELPPRPTHFQQTRPRPFSLVPGEERELSIELDENTTSLFRLLGDDRLRQGWQNSDRIYFSGVARYADDVGIVRTISVCRQYQNATGRFKAIEDTDYEYAD